MTTSTTPDHLTRLANKADEIVAAFVEFCGDSPSAAEHALSAAVIRNFIKTHDVAITDAARCADEFEGAAPVQITGFTWGSTYDGNAVRELFFNVNGHEVRVGDYDGVSAVTRDGSSCLTSYLEKHCGLDEDTAQATFELIDRLYDEVGTQVAEVTYFMRREANEQVVAKLAAATAPATL